MPPSPFLWLPLAPLASAGPELLQQEGNEPEGTGRGLGSRGDLLALNDPVTHVATQGQRAQECMSP